MNRQALCASLLILSTLLAIHSVAAATVEIHVQNQLGEPLSNAVIEQVSLPLATTPPAIATIDQVKKQFSPQQLVIQQGQQVTFPNSDNIRHHVYSFSEGNAFELKLYSGRTANPVTFSQHGVVVLGCNIHDSMVGYLYVAAHPTTTTDTTGNAMLPTEGTQLLTIWHSLQQQGPEFRTQLTVNPQQSHYTVTLTTDEPAARDTFQAKFRADQK